jgi:hypothetical protein
MAMIAGLQQTLWHHMCMHASVTLMYLLWCLAERIQERDRGSSYTWVQAPVMGLLAYGTGGRIGWWAGGSAVLVGAARSYQRVLTASGCAVWAHLASADALGTRVLRRAGLAC